MVVPTKQLIVLAVFIGLDILTGLVKALARKDFASNAMREGLVHKLTELLAACFGYAADYALPIIGVTVRFSIFSAMIVYIVLMEAGSIIENIGQIYPALGEKMKAVFRDSQGDNNDHKNI